MSIPITPTGRLEERFSDTNPALSKSQALVEANRCLYCFDAPCIDACPTGIEIPEFIGKIATDNLKGSAKKILSANILGFSCARVCPVEVLCEGACVYNAMGQPAIDIGRLQRYATDYAYEHGVQFFEAGEATGKRVALVGAGPASLACAHELTRLGHEAVIFEADNVPGGLNTTGIAPYKLNVEDSLREVSYVAEIGIEIRHGVAVGKDIQFSELEAQFDAVFIGVGLGMDGWLKLDGDQLEGVVGALDLIRDIKLTAGFQLPEGLRNAVVIGAGNTAMDAVRELLGLGVPSVTMLYRRDQTVMSGYAHEWSAARQSGASVVWRGSPVAFEGTDGRLTGVRYSCNTADTSDPNYFEGERSVPADLVAVAIGQEKLATLLSSIDGLELDWGRVITDPETGQTGNPSYFSGGDCANGGKEVVNAVAEGKRAAVGIDNYLKEKG